MGDCVYHSPPRRVREGGGRAKSVVKQKAAPVSHRPHFARSLCRCLSPFPFPPFPHHHVGCHQVVYPPGMWCWHCRRQTPVGGGETRFPPLCSPPSSPPPPSHTGRRDAPPHRRRARTGCEAGAKCGGWELVWRWRGAGATEQRGSWSQSQASGGLGTGPVGRPSPCPSAARCPRHARTLVWSARQGWQWRAAEAGGAGDHTRARRASTDG